MKDIPRFGSTLRTNSDLEENAYFQSLDKIDISSCRKTFTSRKNTIELSTYVPNLKLYFNKLRETVASVLGKDESPNVINGTALFFFHLFIDQELLTQYHMNEIKSIFGALFDQVKYKIFELVKEMGKILTPDDREKLKKFEELSQEKESIWGADISVQLPSFKHQSVAHLQEIYPEQFAKNNFGTLDMTYKNQEVKPEEQYFERLLSLTDSDSLLKIVQLLKSKRNVTEIQNDLCELIGFNDFDLILELLANREEFLEKIEKKEKYLKKRDHNVRVTEKRPTIATSVVVQTRLEKDLSKQTRRDEKKLQRLQKNDVLSSSGNPAAVNPLSLRIQQQRNLIESVKQQPLLHTTKIIKKQMNSEKPNYPYVFDSQLLIKQHAAFIGGSKISLPESAEKIDTKQYEEVQIRAAPPPELTVGNNRVQIKDLDEVGKLAFQNTEQLNRIQSIVFPTAYYSNNNLLICAPTGAGKTNVAMLTIVATIRAHIENGTINRNAFKIVYIAPMKALASEMVDNFQKSLKPLEIKVRELTGDMQLTKLEMQQTQILVTTPEKWDVVTRKGVGDVSIISLVKLLIIDEVHLLHGERGPVVEALVARTLRLVESSQSMIRIVGLSATLPNYIDVAHFLRVNPMKGLFYFDSRFRPVPLDTCFVGIKAVKMVQQIADMDNVCYTKCMEMVQKNYQVMVFVHARNATARTATMIREMAQQKNQSAQLLPEDSAGYRLAVRSITKSRNKQLVELFQSGIAIHHAGMLRTDRRLVEKYFADGYVKILVCTSTLAWGVNLPAHAVIIKGTDIYDSKHGSIIDLGILDVLQIFGRAGRPQYDTKGVGTIITTHDKLNHYLSLLTNQFPIESNFIQCLADNLNAEIASGTVTNVDEAIDWLSYTYLFVRMRLNPHCYGIEYSEIQKDHMLEAKRRALITAAAISLDKAKMIRFNHKSSDFSVTELGRTASHFYIKYDTVELFNELLKPFMTEADIFAMISQAQEFQQLKVRDDELEELDELRNYNCNVKCQGVAENVPGKVNILLQTYLSRGFVKSFSLISDMSYIVQNIVRIARAVFTIVLRNNNAILAGRMLQVCQMFEKQIWNTETPLRQFSCLSQESIEKVERLGISVYTLKEMSFSEVKDLIRNQRYADMLLKCANEFPILELEVTLQPITRTVLRLRIDLWANFTWNDHVHGKSCENFWIWVEDPETNFIYHSELVHIMKKTVITETHQYIVMTIPLREPLPQQYYVRVTSDSWLGSKTLYPLSFQHLILPQHNPPLTELLPLRPLAVNALRNKQFESLYSFSHFNPIQTQIFHNLYYTDNNILLGAPTGSGKTIVAEIAILRAFSRSRNAKVVYIAPLKALVKERVNDWKIRFEQNLGKSVVELTGDTSPDIQAIRRSSVIVTTPEKWDSISRSWQTREYVKDVILIIIDEIHLLGEDRGPVIEVIISRTNFIKSHTKKFIRIVGLSTALANAQDLSNWLGITTTGLYNFKPSVRPVPLSVHVHGFSGKHYCPRMATMNRPTYQAIRTYSPSTPAIVFVASRRQTRLTALDLITFVAGDDNPKQFLHIPETEMRDIIENIKDSNVKFCLAFGIGLHHAGLSEDDRKIVENLFLNRKIQILVATATLAWGVNLPAHLVVIKGTEYFDSKSKKYVDMPITDVLQMMGRAGRPQFDHEGVAVVFVHDIKKNFYKKFLYDPFPVESSLLNVLPDHINAEIVSGTVQTKEAAIDYLTWTFFFRRLLRNPSYYNLESVQMENMNIFLSSLIENVLQELELSACITMSKNVLEPTFLGRISSFYYLSHRTMNHFLNNVTFNMDTRDLLLAISDSYEFDQQPVRHNEDILNEELAKLCRYRPHSASFDSPHTKGFLLLQAHIMRLPLPNSDYFTDTKTALDQTIRVMQAMMDYTAERGWLGVTLRLQYLAQTLIQASWFDEPDLLTLPHVTNENIKSFNNVITSDYDHLTLAVLKDMCSRNISSLNPLQDNFSAPQIENILKVVKMLPELTMKLFLQQCFENNEEENLRRICVDKSEWVDVTASEEYVLCVSLFRKSGSNTSYVHCPKYTKPKNEGWFLTLGSHSSNELFAMKRIMARSNTSTHRICFQVPPKKGRIILSLFLISDSYIGLDQQFDLQLNVV